MIRLDQIRSSQRNGGMVKRYHEYPTIMTQTNAEHSWHVARIWLKIFGAGGELAEQGNILVYIIYHDSGELGVGDLPFPTKSNNPALKAEFDDMEAVSLQKQGISLPVLTTYEKLTVKMCDLIEMGEFGLSEQRFGSQYGQSIIDVTLTKIRSMLGRLTSEDVMNTKMYIRDQLGVQL